MNPFEEHLNAELAILKANLKEGDKLVIEEFLPLIRGATIVFSKQGHSGSSAPYYANALANAIKDVLLFRPLSPITGEDSEWVCDHMEEGMCQNKRLGSIFKQKDGRPYYLDAIVWRGEEDGDTFTGSVGDISSRQYIKSFPFTPKTFYVNVVKQYFEGKPEDVELYHEEKAEDGTVRYYKYIINNRAQIEEVFAYYDNFNV